MVFVNYLYLSRNVMLIKISKGDGVRERGNVEWKETEKQEKREMKR